MAHSSHEAIRTSKPAEPSWDDLRLFVAVVSHGSMNGAARALGQSQPTVARRIRALEVILGVPLFQRGANRLDLTAAGRALLEAASPMAEAAHAIPKIAASFRPDPQAPVRVTATSSVTMFLSRHATGLAHAAPTAIAYIPTRNKLDLAASEADIALRMRHLPNDDDLIGRKIGRIAFAVYATSPEYSTVIAPPDDPYLSTQAALIARFTDDRPVVARIGDMPTRYQAAKSGLGAAVLPCWLGDSDSSLVRISPPFPDMIEDIFLVMHRRNRERPAVTQVWNALIDLFRREEQALVGALQG